MLPVPVQEVKVSNLVLVEINVTGAALNGNIIFKLLESHSRHILSAVGLRICL